MRVYEAKLTYEATLFEVGSRSLSTPDAVYAYMKDVLEVHPMHEVFYVILLNRKIRPLGRIAITSGTATAALAHPREVFRPAIIGGATAIICAHNHPSGDPAPSSADVHVTRLWEASHNRVYVKRPIMGTGPRRGSPVERKQGPKAARYFP